MRVFTVALRCQGCFWLTVQQLPALIHDWYTTDWDQNFRPHVPVLIDIFEMYDYAMLNFLLLYFQLGSSNGQENIMPLN